MLTIEVTKKVYMTLTVAVPSSHGTSDEGMLVPQCRCSTHSPTHSQDTGQPSLTGRHENLRDSAAAALRDCVEITQLC